MYTLNKSKNTIKEYKMSPSVYIDMLYLKIHLNYNNTTTQSTLKNIQDERTINRSKERIQLNKNING
ncbi:hypothetical protein FPV210 [Fowlpox virus]|uniref:Uncharacterized protein n=2 Tax=Fowlpox virus TaxID=10261 RepID=Q9J525_FOWPN|nr:hypothetical protein FPV210 [Fowlpox virus]UNS14443.1 ALPV-279 [Albatrosspox virus]WPD91058.1 hypothetical protein PPV_Vac110-fpv210 [Avipoxvirus sp.]CAE52748.1 hypothetical protein [Fowlpox virus isolate HP-438/Munich]AAF44554.1 ORF FPV210 hypothetical protein [Fowlpox virus]ART91643.1 hypothetical protein [Fowlpox virus]